MLKVNEEKLLLDHKELVEKKEKSLAEIEVDAKAYAVAHGYNEEKTAKFIAFTQDLQGNGLSVEEKIKLDILGSYIDEVEEEELKLNVVPEKTENMEAAQSIATIINA